MKIEELKLLLSKEKKDFNYEPNLASRAALKGIVNYLKQDGVEAQWLYDHFCKDDKLILLEGRNDRIYSFFRIMKYFGSSDEQTALALKEWLGLEPRSSKGIFYKQREARFWEGEIQELGYYAWRCVIAALLLINLTKKPFPKVSAKAANAFYKMIKTCSDLEPWENAFDYDNPKALECISFMRTFKDEIPKEFTSRQ